MTLSEQMTKGENGLWVHRQDAALTSTDLRNLADPVIGAGFFAGIFALRFGQGGIVGR